MTQDQLTIEIVGSGTVGSATGRALSDWGHEVIFSDIDETVLADLSKQGYRTADPSEATDADLSMVSVPTPYDEKKGTMVTHMVEKAVETLSEQDPNVVAIRSTVPPTTTEHLADKYGLDHYGMVPEFLFEDSARQDLEELEKIVVGTNSTKARETIKQAFSPQVSTFIEVQPTEAEFIKFGSNLFAATKISFSNEIWRLASHTNNTSDTVNLYPDGVLKGISQISPWFGPDMGMEGGWPYGGHCLPKDTNGLRAWAENDPSVPAPQLSGTIAENELMTL
ncbi:UDP-glucose/GDP-mannose dehydrogenase family protein [Halalkalirubrum salinum]|uniref:UDP-glucose/GDP-mannose dehydrogenase family protein n=1 Tax=Halalkalirubrum salinum TaxID=2563889 RepID=UPI0010FAF069|nr:UDP-glucose/GDP-mannose dehydrogenase family protein [Halalkalirubrum salinum]